MNTLCIYQKTIILSFFKIDTLNFTKYILKELQNYKGKLFLCLPQTQAKMQSTFLTTISQTKFTLLLIKLNTYMQEIKFASNKTVSIGCLFSIKGKKTRTDQSTLQVFLLSPNRNDSQVFKSSSCKIFFFQCVCYRCNLLR